MIATERDRGRAEGATFTLGSADRRELAKRLGAGPWCWSPLAEDLAWMKTVVPQPPPAPIGAVLLLGVSTGGQSAGVWALHAPCEHGSTGCLPLSGDLHASWRERVRHFPRFLPIVWREVVVPERVRAQRLGTWTAPDALRFEPWHELAGRSFELPLLLSSISTLFNIPVRGDCAFTGTVEWDGRIGRVDGLQAKLRAVREVAPDVRTVFIPAANGDVDLTDMVGQWPGVEPLQVRTVASVDEAIQVAFGEDALVKAFVSSAQNDEQRRRYCWDLLHFVKDNSRRHATYRPLFSAARAALDAWGSGLDATGRNLLEWVMAVCDRHDANRGVMPIVSAQERADWAPELQLQYVADLVQQALDTGWPTADEALRVAREELGSLLELDERVGEERRFRRAFDGQLQLLGAVARLLAVGPHPERALHLQESISQAFWERSSWRENLSFQVSEWFRLASALGDVAAYRRALAFDRQVQERGGYTSDGAPFVELSRLGAQLMLEGGDARSELEQIAANDRIAGHVAARATRLLALAGVDRHRQTLLQATAGDEHPQALIARALVQLGAPADASDALATLLTLAPGPVGRLVESARVLGRNAPEYVAKWYPY